MEDTYDAIVLGTGLTECVLSGVLSVEGLKVLHMDRNDYYGGDSASINLSKFWEKFSPKPKKDNFGVDRDWNIDLIPKFIMANGKLVKILLHTGVTRYLEFKAVDGSYVYRDGKVNKVPANDTEAMKSPLLGLFEKRRARKFFIFVQGLEENDEKTWEGLNVKKLPMSEVYKEFGLAPETQEFIGHAMALYTDDSYLDAPAIDCLQRIRLYAESLARYGKSPYLYPMFGLGELPQSFARLCAIYGGTYMLHMPDCEVVYDDNGVVKGVKSGDQVAKANVVIGDPSYFPGKSKKVGEVVRAICFLNAPIPNTENAESTQIIIPQAQVNRKSDIYVCMVSYAHKIAGKGWYVAIASTMVETDNPESELQAAFELMGDIKMKSVSVSPVYAPKSDGTKDKAFISRSYDASTHFESVCDDILDLYKRITGKDMDLTPHESTSGEEY